MLFLLTKDLTPRLLLALAAAAAVQLAPPFCLACYFPDGTHEDTYLPCASNSDVCCKQGDTCLAGPICESRGDDNSSTTPDSNNNNNNNNRTFYRPNCASQTWSDAPACSQYCVKDEMPYLDALGADQPVGRCSTGSRGDLFYCKDRMESMVNCQQQMLVFTLTGWNATTLGTGGATGVANAAAVVATSTTAGGHDATAATSQLPTPTTLAVRLLPLPPLATVGPRGDDDDLSGSGSGEYEDHGMPLASIIGASVAAVIVLCTGVACAVSRRRRRQEQQQQQQRWEQRNGSELDTATAGMLPATAPAPVSASTGAGASEGGQKQQSP